VIDAQNDAQKTRVHGSLWLYHGDAWSQHFAFLHNYLYVVGITPLGLATEKALGFNDGRLGGPLATRHDTILKRRYPPRWARPLLV